MDVYLDTFQHVAQPATAFALAAYNACFVERGGAVRCVGDDRHGSLGETPPGATPARVDLSCR